MDNQLVADATENRLWLNFLLLNQRKYYVAIWQYKNYGPPLDFGIISKIGGCHMAAHVIAVKFFCGTLPLSCCHGTSCNQC